MVISCPHCSTRFKVPDEKFKQGTLKVRCSKCKNIFNAASKETEETDEATASPAPRDQGDVNLDFNIGEETAPPAKKPVTKPTVPPPNLLSGDNILDIPTPKPAAKPIEKPTPPPFLVDENPQTPEFSLAEPDPPDLMAPPEALGDFSPEMKNIDDELNVLLDTPNGGSDELPLTMPQDIDLKSLAKPKSSSLKKTTDDGIELLDDLTQMDEKPPRMPLLNDKKDSAAPQNRSKPQMPSLGIPIEPYEEQALGPSKKHLGKLLAIIFLMIAVGGVVFAFTTGKIEIGNLQNLFANLLLSTKNDKAIKPTATALTQISVLHTTSLIITTAENRPVLVISGEVRNGYATAQSFLRVKAQMINHEGQVMSEKEVFAGNFFTRDEIYYFTDQEMIDKKYSDSGKSLANLNVSPDGVIPFQIMIMNPDPLWEQFKVTSSGSQAAASGS